MTDTQNFELLTKKIEELRKLLSNAMTTQSEITEDDNYDIQAQLDEKEYYIKLMPKDGMLTNKLYYIK